MFFCSTKRKPKASIEKIHVNKNYDMNQGRKERPPTSFGDQLQVPCDPLGRMNNPNTELIQSTHKRVITHQTGIANPVLPDMFFFGEVFRNAVELQVNSSRFFCHPQHGIARIPRRKGCFLMSFPAWIYTYIYISTLISSRIFGIDIHWDILCHPVHCSKKQKVHT